MLAPELDEEAAAVASAVAASVRSHREEASFVIYTAQQQATRDAERKEREAKEKQEVLSASACLRAFVRAFC